MRQTLWLTMLIAMTLLSACKQDAALTPPATSTAPAAHSAGSVTTSAPSAAVLTSGSKVVVAGEATEKNIDFNGDGKPDRYEVVTTDRDNDGLGFVRELQFYTVGDDQPWYVSEAAVLSTEHGGMMGDPLEGISHTEKGVVRINHFGGSRDKWKYTHSYRWQKGDFKLIGATINHGAPCDAWTVFDYNLSTGKANFSQKTEDCSEGADKPQVAERKQSFIRMTSLPSMKTNRIGETEVNVPNMDATVYY